MTVPPLIKEIAVGEVRHVLGELAGGLVLHGYLMQGAISPEVLSGISLAIVTMLLSALSKVGAKQKSLTAAMMPAGSTEAQVKNVIALGFPTPSVLTPANQAPVATVH
jgi:hypothetical protein